jgi:hypothetical protein
MKTLFLAFALLCGVMTNAQTSSDYNVGVQVYPVKCSGVAKLTALKFPDTTGIIKHYDKKNRLDLYVEKTPQGGLWIITFENNDTSVYQKRIHLVTIKNNPGQWYTDTRYLKEVNGKEVPDKGYISSQLKKMVKILNL